MVAAGRFCSAVLAAAVAAASAAAVAAAAAAAESGGPLPTGIDTVVVVQLENRAFDALLGHLKAKNPRINGLTGDETNPIDPRDPSKGVVKTSFDQVPVMGFNPGHSLDNTKREVWGGLEPVNPAPMNGFVYELTLNKDQKAYAKDIMRAYNGSTVPVISTLATDFAVFDAVYSSVPGPTGPNRLFSLSGTSHGTVSNVKEDEVKGFPQRTIMNDFEDAGLPWAVYFGDFPIALQLEQLRKFPDNFHDMDTFLEDAKLGRLPSFSWVEPRFFSFGPWPESDEHPHTNADPLTYSDIRYGELLLKEVYEALRASPKWNSTLFIVTYDEHGGCMDHVPPPQPPEVIPNPDGLTNPDFNFTRLGVRIPFVAVSPWIDAGVVEGEPALHRYDHTSVMATMRKIFPQLPQRGLTKREDWAASFEHILTGRQTPRTDCPTTLPSPPGSDVLQRWKIAKQWRDDGSPRSIALVEALAQSHPELMVHPPHLWPTTLVSDLQLEVLEIAHSLVQDGTQPPREDLAQMTMHEGGTFIRSQLWKFRHGQGQQEEVRSNSAPNGSGTI